jgi:carbamate kinase
MESTPRTWVVALGGNALADPHDPGAIGRQEASIESLASAIAPSIAAGHRILLVHGNGPQVGARMMQNELASARVPPSPLHDCVAETQGHIGHHIALYLRQALDSIDSNIPVTCLVTHVLVDPDTEAFRCPDKPIGPVYSASEARSHIKESGWELSEQPGGGWRRVVPSPRPGAVLESDAINSLLAAGHCVVAGGGGGIPFSVSQDGMRAEDAVVDKDHTAQLLGTAAGADRLVVLTDVPGVATSYSRDGETFLSSLSVPQAKVYLEEGEFAPGSMRPKVEACLDFLRLGGSEAIIASAADAASALAGSAGTRLTL